MTLAHRVETVLSADGKLVLDHLPFRAGQPVEVIVLPKVSETTGFAKLKGMVLRYDDPTEPIAEDDWEVLQ
jgi:hypothetical protein